MLRLLQVRGPGVVVSCVLIVVLLVSSIGRHINHSGSDRKARRKTKEDLRKRDSVSKVETQTVTLDDLPQVPLTFNACLQRMAASPAIPFAYHDRRAWAPSHNRLRHSRRNR